MPIEAIIRADSISPDNIRLMTLELTMPRCILAQFNTHRQFSRNAASSRAIPTRKLIQQVMDDPFIPIRWGTAQKGMIAGEELSPRDQEQARNQWLIARDQAVFRAKDLAKLGVAKEHVNRLLEPFAWVKVLVTSTAWRNFFDLRLHHAAQPEMQELARCMMEAMRQSTPREVRDGEWHIPFDQPDLPLPRRIQVATARCARISYLTHDGQHDPERDVELYTRLLNDRHMSPFEHCARPGLTCSKYANLEGWMSQRYLLEHGHLDWILSQENNECTSS